MASAGMVKAVEENAEALVRDKASSGFVGDVMFFAEGGELLGRSLIRFNRVNPYLTLNIR